MTTLVTGATGFLGGAVVAAAARFGPVRCAVRQARGEGDVVVGDIGPDTQWGAALAGVDTVIHLAGLAHAKHDRAALHRVNAEGAAALARQARAAGVRRFMFISSAKAAVDVTARPARETDPPVPRSAYGQSKLAGERAVLAEAPSPVVLRPPLVFAPDAKANFAALLKLAASGLPLPFAGLNNRRSLIARDSLAAAVAAVLLRPDGPSGVFYIADQPSLSTPDMIAALREGMGRRRGLFRAPVGPPAPAALRQSLEVDDGAFRAAYGYGPAPRLDAYAALVAVGAAWTAARR